MNTYRSNFVLPKYITNELLKCALQDTSYRKYVTNKSTSTELYISSDSPFGGICANNVAVKKLRSIIAPKFLVNAVVFLKFMPNAALPPHIDDSLLRTSCITWALMPELSNVSPVIYHRSFDDLTVVETCYYTEFPVILNTQKVHSLVNNDYTRILVQLCLSNPIEELVEADLKNELFTRI